MNIVTLFIEYFCEIEAAVLLLTTSGFLSFFAIYLIKRNASPYRRRKR